jgi:hypothetical protein
MKHFSHLLSIAILAIMLFTSCSQEENIAPDQNLRISLRDADDCSTVDLTYPASVNVDESFDIEAAIECGRVALERAYVLDMDGVTRIYSGLTCDTDDLLWELLVNNECYTDDLSTSMSLDDPGTYVFRTKHTAADGNCDNFNPTGPGNPGDCEFNGVNFCCFMIEAIGCENALTAEVSCETDEDGCNRHVTFTFTAEEDGPIVIQGGLTHFTTICSATATGGLVQNTTHPGVVNSEANVTRWEGDVVACEEYSVTIHWTSTNDDPEITGKWTAKRGEVELAYVCPLNCEGESAEECEDEDE